MGLSGQQTRTLVAPQPKGILDPATGKPVGANDPFFTDINDELADKGFLVTSTDDHPMGPHGLLDVDDLRPCLLCSRDDAVVDAPL